jgi:hypothetical protein
MCESDSSLKERDGSSWRLLYDNREMRAARAGYLYRSFPSYGSYPPCLLHDTSPRSLPSRRSTSYFVEMQMRESIFDHPAGYTSLTVSPWSKAVIVRVYSGLAQVGTLRSELSWRPISNTDGLRNGGWIWVSVSGFLPKSMKPTASLK